MTVAFLEGIDMVEEECRKSVIALMCSEKDPTNCHRTFLVGHHLYNLGCDVRHIIPGQPNPEPHSTLLERLMRRHRLDDPEQAVNAQSDRAAYRGETDPPMERLKVSQAPFASTFARTLPADNPDAGPNTSHSRHWWRFSQSA